MRAGNMDRSVSIEFPIFEESAAYGRQLVRWDRLVTCRAQVVEMMPSRSEAVRQGLATARNQTRVRMRYRNDIDSTMRIIVHGGDQDIVYQIVGGPAMLGRQDALEMVCERYSTTGAAT